MIGLKQDDQDMYFYLIGRHSNCAVRIDSEDRDLADKRFCGSCTANYNPPQVMPILTCVVEGKKRTLRLSRIVLERKLGRPLTKGEQADHKNRNILDNRRSNLRVASNMQNQANRLKTKRSTSGYKGVSWFKHLGKWRADIQKDGKLRYLGHFSDKVEAAKAYDRAALELFGEFALLNFSNGE